jgi:hypothetical protein
VTRAREISLVALVIGAACTVVALAQTPPEIFTATASVKGASAQATADVRVQVDRYATEDQRAALIKAVRSGDAATVTKALASLPDAGYIELGERRTPVKFAGRQETPDGQLITVVTATPLVFLGAGLPAAKPTSGFDIAIAILEVKKSDPGMGELAPAAKVGVDKGGALVIQDYGKTVVVLNRVARGK